MSLPLLTGVGRLVDDPELRFTPQGKAVAKMRLAFSARRRNQQTNEWEDGDKCFLDGTVWDQLAENVAESLTKGAEVVVSGRLKQRQYETKEGEKRTVYELMLDSIGPSLKFATAKPQKSTRDSGNSNSGSGRWSQDQPVPTSAGGFDDEPPF